MNVVFSTMTAMSALTIVSTTYGASSIGKEKIMLNIRTFTFSVVLVAIFVLTVALAITRPEKDSHAWSNAARVAEIQERPADINHTYRAPSYRSQFGECYDVPIRELAACRDSSQAVIQVQHSAVDECIDVSFWEIASCRKASQAPTP
jgi:hypothetical protein